MIHLGAKIEAILFAIAEPMTKKKLSKILEVSMDEVDGAVERLMQYLDTENSGLRLIENGGSIELVTAPEMSDIIQKVIKQDVQGELTRPSLEALTILAYRGPMTRPELEQIRGVQSSMILRNLMMRGLVQKTDTLRLGQPLYAVTIDFLKHLGLTKQKDLPDFEALNQHEIIEDVLADLEASLPSDASENVKKE